MSESVNSGLPAVGELPWGSHFCQFYETAEDLVDTLVPYFKAGLEGNEQCMWVTSEPFPAAAAESGLRCVVADLDDRKARGQIEIVDYDTWYLRAGKKDPGAVLAGWLQRKDQALAQGYAGLRLTGNTFWLESKDWRDFAVRSRHAFRAAVAELKATFSSARPARSRGENAYSLRPPATPGILYYQLAAVSGGVGSRLLMSSDHRVLVVEDDAGYAHALLRQLRTIGIEASTVATSFEALDLVEGGERLDLLVLDIRLGCGQPHGIALARMVRTKRNVKTVFLSGYDLDPQEIEGLGPLLRKDDGVEAVVQAIAEILKD